MTLHNSSMRFVLNIYHFTYLVSFRYSWNSFHLCSFQSLKRTNYYYVFQQRACIKFLERENAVKWFSKTRQIIKFLNITLYFKYLLTFTIIFSIPLPSEKKSYIPTCSQHSWYVQLEILSKCFEEISLLPSHHFTYSSGNFWKHESE